MLLAKCKSATTGLTHCDVGVKFEKTVLKMLLSFELLTLGLTQAHVGASLHTCVLPILVACHSNASQILFPSSPLTLGPRGTSPWLSLHYQRPH